MSHTATGPANVVSSGLMNKRVVVFSVLLAGLAIGTGHLLAQAPRFFVLEPGFPLWAYGYKSLPTMPEDWSGRCPGNTPRDCDRPGGMPPDTTGQKLSLAGSKFTFTVA